MQNLLQTIDGKKTYITIAIGMLAVFLNGIGWWPNDIVPLHLDPSNWVNTEWTLVLGLVGRSALAKNSAAAIAAQQGAKGQ